MNNLHKRYLLFLLGCIPLRTLIVFYTKNSKNLKYLAIYGLVMFISWTYLFMTKSRMTGQEVFGDKIWWHNLRPIHATLHLAFAHMAYYENDKAYVPLLLDTFIGLLAFGIYHVNNKKLI